MNHFVAGLATDLDQRLLPDVLTLPVIPIALVYALTGANPLVGDEVVLAVAAAVAIPALLYLPSIPFGAGAFGDGGSFPSGLGSGDFPGRVDVAPRDPALRLELLQVGEHRPAGHVVERLGDVDVDLGDQVTDLAGPG